LPLAEEANNEVAAESRSQNLREEVNVADERSLQNDGDVRGIEELDGEWLSVTLGLSSGQLELDLEILQKRKSLMSMSTVMITYLEPNDNEHDDNGGGQVTEVGGVLTLEGLIDTVHRVRLGHDEMEGGDDGALELSALVRTDGHGRETLPHDCLANVGGNEERNTGAEAITLLEELIEHEYHEASEEKLSNDDDGAEDAELANGTVHAGQEVSEGLTEGDEEAEELLSRLEKLAIVR
jgi:hypothetical protein